MSYRIVCTEKLQKGWNAELGRGDNADIVLLVGTRSTGSSPAHCTLHTAHCTLHNALCTLHCITLLHTMAHLPSSAALRGNAAAILIWKCFACLIIKIWLTVASA